MTARKKMWVLRAVTAAAAALIVLGLRAWIGGRGTVPLPLRDGAVLLAPRWLYLLGVIPALFLVVRSSLTDLSRAQLALAAFVRACVVAGIALALARPSAIVEEQRVSVVALVDVSDSISDTQLAAAQSSLDELWAAVRARGEDDRIDVVTFAERPLFVAPPDPDHAPRLARHPGGGAGSDLQAALQLAYGLYPPGYLPRALILSDGNQTSGDVASEAYRAQEFGVHVSWKLPPDSRPKEIRLAALHLPSSVKVGAPFELTADVWATHAEDVTIRLRHDDFPNALDPQQRVTLVPGLNRVVFKSEAKNAGFTTYRAILDTPKEDAEKANNETVASVPVRGRPHVLFIEGEADRNPKAASYLKASLDKENIDVEVRGPRGLPSNVKELERYDLVLLSDVAATFVGMNQMIALERYVTDLGGGFIMSGGENSFGSGGYQGTRIETLLPVRFDGQRERSEAQVALALVIDRSGSMQGDKIEMAKESARATAEVMDASDLLGVIAFDSQPTTVVRLQRAANRLKISTDIASLQPGGGTNILPALQEAYQALLPAQAKVKHVILLSDGQANIEGIAELCEEMRKNRITVSAVGIGDADRNLLTTVAEHGEGRFYMTDNLAELPRIFLKETEEVQKSSLVEDTIFAHVAKRVEMIEGTGVENAPALRGYVSTKAKPGAEVVLVTDRAEPLLARWRVGTGQVVAWTSDVKPRWAVDWLVWPGFTKFWAQVIRTTMRHQEHESYDLAASVVDGRARVVVDAIARDDKFVNGLDTTLEVIDPRTSKAVTTAPMAQTAAGRYEGTFPVDRYGTFLLKAVHRREGRVVAESVGTVALPYPAEYSVTGPNPTALAQAAVISGGLENPTPKQLLDAGGEKILYHEDLWPWVLMAVAIAFLADVYLRRVRFLGYRTMKL